MTEHPLKKASLADKIAYVRLIAEMYPGYRAAKDVMDVLGISVSPLLEEHRKTKVE
ncbi:hypothetical protein V6582_17915 [Agrobacterium vitis]|uniref:hypothetical protein n=1 Tax=Agrobacterium vitis TaxID=373 RepID=UPI0012E974E1|nr:hypothetical protein [Agrobacterium vitis]MVA23207.1 hypothetical protein [Agrobacterium vitis]